MSEISKYQVPRTLDDPGRILWWDVDQALLVCMFLVFGMVAGYLLIGMITGLSIGWVYGKSKSGRHKGYAIHLMYWFMPSGVLGLRRTPPSHHRELIG